MSADLTFIVIASVSKSCRWLNFPVSLLHTSPAPQRLLISIQLHFTQAGFQLTQWQFCAAKAAVDFLFFPPVVFSCLSHVASVFVFFWWPAFHLWVLLFFLCLKQKPFDLLTIYPVSVCICQPGELWDALRI